MAKVFILREEDLYSKGDDSDCWCSNNWIIKGVFSTKELAEKELDRKEKVCKEMNGNFRRGFFDIDEHTIDEDTY